MKYNMSPSEIKKQIQEKLVHTFGVVSVDNATDEEFYKALAMILREKMAQGRSEFIKDAAKKESKRIYYLCMEFLLGRSLKNTLFNLGLEENVRKALTEMQVDLDKLYEQEPDAGLGNGGLGRLAACFLDSLASEGYPAMGYSLRYEYGMFRQKFVEGWQTELPDFWLPGGEVWMQKVADSAFEIRFGGHVDEEWHDQYHVVHHREYESIRAIPYDLFVAGIDGKGISILRIWKAEADKFDMKLFNGGNYLHAMEANAMAEVVTKVLYPEDNHEGGKILRLTQQYFLVSASVQDIIRRHLMSNRTLDNLPELAAIHLNDTHPVLAIPELMRVMLDECGYDWESAWKIVTRTIAYTNHTVMSEALECWRIDLFKMRLPRIYQIVEEINRRFWEEMKDKNVHPGAIEYMAPIGDGYVKMANLAVIGSHSVNGVSELHSEILKDDLFHDFYQQTPEKFKNVTNGIAHRRWLNQANPKLAAFLNETIGDGYIYDAAKLSGLLSYKDDSSALQELQKIKHSNKVRLANYIQDKQGILIDPNSIFDVQIKRLHEYKRQHMNALHILATYQWLKENPNADFTPHTYIFGAKAAAGYYLAKEIISFILHLADTINNDPSVNQKMKVVFVENYCVTWAELLTPAAEISEQISLAGTEASGTSNMKFMINGALTLGTLDGANVEIHQAVGDENMFLFGMTASQVEDLRKSGYQPRYHYDNNPTIHKALDAMQNGLNGKNFKNIVATLLNTDHYMAFADFDAFAQAQKKAAETYANQTQWNRMSLMNIAHAGIFSSDRSIRDYAERIWHTESAFKK
ncbi:glycogen/starch/alpha-glucan phosphorylase [Scatolibacter rhodanostii]|uniref:glycogen/starch/alpha-glucan phosphorylase n=1 Tax=Scatolibacter rhodanostii TaxID=2014781 RepID=UPI001FA86FC3|nr:glycogen/starch/alpha-glucan phosphorylase [Scatolibacter rhodanostii]